MTATVIQLPYQDRYEDAESFRERLAMWRAERGWKNHPVPLIPAEQRPTIQADQWRAERLADFRGRRA